MEIALKEVGIKNNIAFDIGRISYNTLSGSMKLSIADKSLDGVSDERATFNARCRKHGLFRSDYGRLIQFQGREFTIVGCTDRRNKNGIKIKASDDGITYNGTTISVRQILERSIGISR